MGYVEKILSELSDKESKKDIREDEENGPDVIIEVPNIKADTIKMEAENVKFSFSVKVQLKNFTNVEIGTDIHIDKIKLDIDSLEAEAYFQVKLKKIETMVLKALESLDDHPNVLKFGENGSDEDDKSKDDKK